MDQIQLTAFVAAAKHSKRALEPLLNACSDDFYYFALQLLQDWEAAARITKQALLRIKEDLKTLQDPADFFIQSRKALYADAIRLLRQEQRLKLLHEVEDPDATDFLTEDSLGSFIPTPQMEQPAFRMTILKTLEKLTQEQRATVLLYHCDELTIRQIAAIQGVSERLIETRLNYACKLIRAAVEICESSMHIPHQAYAVTPLLQWVLEGDREENPLPVQIYTATCEKACGPSKRKTPLLGGRAGAFLKKGLITAVVVALIFGFGLFLYKSGVFEGSDPIPPATYETETMTPQCVPEQPESVVRYLGDTADWYQAADGAIYKTRSGERIFEGIELQEFYAVAGKIPVCLDQNGDLHFLYQEKDCRVSGVKGTVVYAFTKEGEAANRKLLCIYSVDEENTLYYSAIDPDDGSQKELNAPLFLRNVETEKFFRKPDAVRFYEAGDGFYTKIGEQCFSSSIPELQYDEGSSRYYLDCRPVEQGATMLTHQHVDMFTSGLYVKEGDDRNVYCASFPSSYSVALPEGYTTDAIAEVLFFGRAVLKMNDGTFYTVESITDFGADPVFVKCEELSALAIKGSVKQFFFDDYSDDDPALLVWMDDGLLYRVSL